MDNKSFLETEISPFKQVAVVLLIAVIFMSFSGFIPAQPYSSTAHIMPWVIACGLILFFAIGNSILSLSATNGNIYWLQSIISFAIMLIGGGLLAWGFSGISISNTGSVKWIYFVFTFSYLVFLSIVNLMKFLVNLAKKHDNKMQD